MLRGLGDIVPGRQKSSSAPPVLAGGGTAVCDSKAGGLHVLAGIQLNWVWIQPSIMCPWRSPQDCPSACSQMSVLVWSRRGLEMMHWGDVCGGGWAPPCLKVEGKGDFCSPERGIGYF